MAAKNTNKISSAGGCLVRRTGAPQQAQDEWI